MSDVIPDNPDKAGVAVAAASTRCHALIWVVLWTLALLVALAMHLVIARQQVREQAYAQAGVLFENESRYRDWNAGHGGVYVVKQVEDEHPYLAHLPDHEIPLPDGRRLTLVPHDYMARQSVSGHGGNHVVRLITLDAIHPDHRPDPWERAGLAALVRGEGEVVDVTEADGTRAMRLLRPLKVREACLKCHYTHGFTVGAAVGGLSLTIPLDSLQAQMWRQMAVGILGYTALWLIGLAGIRLSRRNLLERLDEVGARTRQLQEAERSIHRLTFFDPQTELPNRLLFNDRLHMALLQAERSGSLLAVGVIGIDHFKRIKNTFGLPVGEALLGEAVRRIQAALRGDDTLATLAEGRFLLLLPAIGKGEDLARVATKVQQALSGAVTFEGRDFYLSVSQGYAVFPDDADEAKSLIGCADAAFSRAKTRGRNSYHFYTPHLNERALEQITLENALRRALAENELLLYFQPQVDAVSGRINGAEALLRWRHPERGLVSPLEFIPLAEETGMILAIGEWALKTACREAVAWPSRPGEQIEIAVNISPRQFMQGNLVEIVDAALAESGLPPHCLVLELTEGTIVQDVDSAIEILVELKKRGIRIAIDDFGTGYSSLNYLKQFPLDQVKIDKSFVFDLERRGTDNVIVSSIVTMAQRMSLNIVAEGVETAAQRDHLLTLGCRCMQGYYFSRPIDAEHFRQLVIGLLAEEGDFFSWWVDAPAPAAAPAPYSQAVSELEDGR